MPAAVVRAWSAHPVHLTSTAGRRVVANRLRVQLAGPLNRAAVHEGLYGEVGDSHVRLAWLRPTELSLLRPRLVGQLVERDDGTHLIGRFAIARGVRILLAVLLVGMLFTLYTLVVGLFRGPSADLVFLLGMFVCTAALVKVTADYLMARFGELCEHLQQHLALVIADPPAAREPRRKVPLEVERPDDPPHHP